MFNFLLNHAKRISVVSGFVFGTVGVIWSFVVVDALNEKMTQLSNTKAEMRRQVESLNSIASEYFISNQMGDLIFVLALQDSARQDIAGLIYKGNMLDRATPVRNMVGALAIAKQLDYRQTYDAYEKLNDDARANLSPDNFTKLKQAEKDIVVKGQERAAMLINGLFEIEKAINANGAEQKRSRVIGLASSVFGNLLLLFASLIAESRQH